MKDTIDVQITIENNENRSIYGRTRQQKYCEFW